jgi:clan AA aspartic protease
MISGIVNSSREAALEIVILDSAGRPFNQGAMVDTGYNGWLTLSPNVIASLGLRWIRYGRAMLADGGQIVFNIYEAVVVWDGQLITIPVDEMDAMPLIGMALMYGYELVLPVLDGAQFTLRNIANP